MRKKRPPRWAWPIMLWEVAWKAVAVRKAVQQREWKWVLPLIAVNSAGLLPLWFVFFRAPSNQPDEAGV